MIKAVTGRACTDAADDANTNDTDNNTTRRTEHDCIGSLPNEPKSYQAIAHANTQQKRSGK